jgi:SNF2 family DNA or RNA helicase
VATLEELKTGASIRGILPNSLVTVETVKWYGTDALELMFKGPTGKPDHQLLYRHDEARLEIVESGKPWSFNGDASLFRVVSEARRIQLAYLFDPLLAVHTSLVDPLPHQITAVYGEMVQRQPLRFLLADDPGAGKTIMAGLLIKELIARGDVQKCMIVCPGNLVDQWQDEMDTKFHLPFEIMTNDKLEAARTGNWFNENPLAICRLDKLSRNEEVQIKLKGTDWDLIICDEAHKMSATVFGNEVKRTKRYELGRLLSSITRHFLLMTATPHNGKEADFQLFLALLDGDRFEGRFRDGVHKTDTSDLMRRLVKEQLLKFDGTPLFPERIAYTANYTLSDDEAKLYERVTDYVRQEFNRADALENDGRRGTVGFALTILQRRLASSPEAIYQSLRRRRERLEARLKEEKILNRGATARIELDTELPRCLSEDLEDLEDSPDEEFENIEERVVDRASAARTIAELSAEIATLRKLEAMANAVRQSGTDKKWEELSHLLQDTPEMFDAHGHRRKLIIFTEHRDTMNYLTEKIRALVGKPESVINIHGSMGREKRKIAEQDFTQDKEVAILVATDAAGEGINLQRAHLMVNYDLPWNPNRIEQRFGRIHRIGQTEVCHLWNLVAAETREGEVYHRLLEKIAAEREALGGQVFDVLGRLTFEDRPLRELLMDAIRYGDKPEVRARLQQVVDTALDRNHLRQLLDERALARDSMDASQVRMIREEMERAEAHRLQPHFIAAFFIEAIQRLGGSIKERESRRYEIMHVPATIRNRNRIIGTRLPIPPRYERITFEKTQIALTGKPVAAFICPGHPLLDAVIDLILEQHRDLLKQGAILVDENDPFDQVRALVFLEHSIQDAHIDHNGQRRIVSRRLQFVELDGAGNARTAGYAPYLDYRPLTADEKALIPKIHEPDWMKLDFETKVQHYAVTSLVPEHFTEVQKRKVEIVDKIQLAVKARLTSEIRYWDHRANGLKEQELAGKVNAKLNSGLARQRADELTARLHKRMQELEEERNLSPLPPVIVGGALVISGGLLARLRGSATEPALFAHETARVEALAMAAVMQAEKKLGFAPRDVSKLKCGYDIESAITQEGRLRFIEVKGRVKGATSVTVTKNEVLTALNKPEDFILAIVEVDGEIITPRYVRTPFRKEPDFGVTSVNYDLAELLAHASNPK